MSLERILMDPSADWRREPPACEDSIQQLIRKAGVEFPDSYLEFLRYSNGGEGELGIQPLWFAIFPAEEVLGINRDYSYGLDDLPGYFAFGSDLGGDLLVFNTRETQPWKVYYVDMISMTQEDVLLCAPTFEAFVQAMGRSSGVE